MAYPVAVHYGYNGLFLGYRHTNFYVPDQNVTGYCSWVGYTPGEVKHAGERVMFADVAIEISGQPYPNHTVYAPIGLNFPNGWARMNAIPSVHGRHRNKRANVAWVDGHCTTESVRFYDDQTPSTRALNIGFLAPDLGGARSNEWMFIK